MDDLTNSPTVDLSYLWQSLPPMGDWVVRAACGNLGYAADVFTDDHPDPDEQAVAERICRRCPVRDECAGYAADAPVYGMWAGQWHTMKAMHDRERQRAA